MIGPWRRRTSPPLGGWIIVADEHRAASGGTEWDVRAVHEDGTRVPAGPNFHRAPEAEMARLVRLIERSDRELRALFLGEKG